MSVTHLSALSLLALLPVAAPAAPVHGAAAQAPELRRLAAKVAELWGRGDAARIAELAAPAGLELQLVDQRHLPMGGRRAAAALKAFFSLRQGESARVTRVEELGGTPPRGFVEIEWTTTSPRATQRERFTLFLGLVLEDEGWRISELRVLR